MKKIVSIILSAMLLCSIFAVPAFAGAAYNSDVTVSASFAAAVVKSSSAQTVVLNINTSKQVDLFSIGYKVKVPEGWSITAIESGSADIVYSSDEGHYSLTSGVVSWYKAVNKSTNAAGSIGKITISVPAGTDVGEYTVEVTDIELATSEQNDDNAWMTNGSATAKLTVKVLSGISVKTAPSKVSYFAGENFSKSGMVVVAAYSDGSTKTITDYTITDGNNLTPGKKNVTISYTENGVTKTTTQAITVTEKVMTAIEIEAGPAKTSYKAGEDFDPTGMKIRVSYNDKTSEIIPYYTISYDKDLKAGQTYVMISYTYNGVTLTVNQPITVSGGEEPVEPVDEKTVSEISVSKAPTKTAYEEGQDFDPAGMEITVKYSDGTTAKITDYKVIDGKGLKAGQTSVTVSYTENGVTKTVKVAITVSEVNPHTDDAGFAVWAVLCTVSAAAAAVLFARKKNEEN